MLFVELMATRENEASRIDRVAAVDEVCICSDMKCLSMINEGMNGKKEANLSPHRKNYLTNVD